MGEGIPVVQKGMEALAAALKSILTTDAFMANLTALIPVIGGVLVFAFTYRLVRKLIKGSQNGKANI